MARPVPEALPRPSASLLHRARTRLRPGPCRPEQLREVRAMTRKSVVSDRVPAALGPYSQAIVAGGFVFCSGTAGPS